MTQRIRWYLVDQAHGTAWPQGVLEVDLTGVAPEDEDAAIQQCVVAEVLTLAMRGKLAYGIREAD